MTYQDFITEICAGISLRDRDFIQRLVSYAGESEHGRQPSLKAVAARMFLTAGQVNRRVKAITGMTTQQFVMRLYVYHACELLVSDPYATVGEVGMRCGFLDTTSFSRSFRRVMGISPSDYRKRHALM